MKRCFACWPAAWLALAGAMFAAEPDFQSKHYSIGLARTTPRFTVLALDSLGQGHLAANPVLPETDADSGLRLETLSPGCFAYVVQTAHGPSTAAWHAPGQCPSRGDGPVSRLHHVRKASRGERVSSRSPKSASVSGSTGFTAVVALAQRIQARIR